MRGNSILFIYRLSYFSFTILPIVTMRALLSIRTHTHTLYISIPFVIHVNTRLNILFTFKVKVVKRVEGNGHSFEDFQQEIFDNYMDTGWEHIFQTLWCDWTPTHSHTHSFLSLDVMQYLIIHLNIVERINKRSSSFQSFQIRYGLSRRCFMDRQRNK